MKNLLTVVLCLVVVAATADSASRVVCYYSSWAVYRQGEGHFNVENIDPTLCTHIVYSFAKISNEGEMQVFDDYNDVGDEWHEGQFTKLQKMRALSPSTKVMIAIGGWNLGAGPFQATVVDPVKRQRWVDTAVAFCQKYQFDGLDIDWEYQDSAHGGTPEQLEGFNEVLRMFRKRFDQEGLILSAATAAGFTMIEMNYDMKVLSETLDFINLMAYDLHGAWEKYTGHHSVLHAASYENGTDRNLNVEAVLRKYIERGADPAKINMGLPTYGRGFTLASKDNFTMYSPATGPSQMGTMVPEAGILAYAEICKNRWQEYWEPEMTEPYAVKGDQWVGYDTAVSLANKISFLRTLNVTSYMVWSIETDDFTGRCFGETFPLLKAINKYSAMP